MPIGTVKFFNESKGYGFIVPDKAHILEAVSVEVIGKTESVAYMAMEFLEGKELKDMISAREPADCLRPRARSPRQDRSGQPALGRRARHERGRQRRGQ